MVPQALRVIFIGGAGRSGSTVLDRVLGRVDGFVSLGEVNHIWERGFVENQLCGCGKPLKACAFWCAVIEEAFGSNGWGNESAFLELQRSVARLRHLPSLLFPAVRSHRFSANLNRYITLLGCFYRAIAKISGCNTLIDSSKLPPHGFILSEIPGMEVSVIHLVRDSRAVAYSWQRRKVRPEIYWKESYMRRRGCVETVYEWMLCNLFIEVLSRKVERYTIMQYEQFAQFPKEEIARLLTWAGAKAPLDFFMDERTVDLGIAHTVSGNPSRFEHGTVKIRPDRAWSKEMPFEKKYVVSGVTFPLLMRYYKKGRPGKERNADASQIHIR